MTTPTDPPPPDQPDWDKAAVAVAIGQLDAVRGTAEKWVGSVTALLGIFSSVALVTGVTAVTDVRWEWLRITLIIVMGLAGVAAGLAIFFGAMAAQGAGPQRHTNWNGTELRATVTDQTPKAVRNLKISRNSGVAAAVLVFCVGMASLVVSAVPKHGDTGPSVVVIHQDGSVRCGELKAESSGAATVAGQRVAGASSVVPVDRC